MHDHSSVYDFELWIIMNRYELQKGKTTSQRKTMESRLVLGPETSWPKTLCGCATFEGVIFKLQVLQPVESREVKRQDAKTPRRQGRNIGVHNSFPHRWWLGRSWQRHSHWFGPLGADFADFADNGSLKPEPSCEAQLLLRMWFPWFYWDIWDRLGIFFLA